MVTAVKPSSGYFNGFVLGETAAGEITVYDHASAASGDVVAKLKSNIVEGTYIFDVDCKRGIVVECVAASKLTVIYE